MNTDLRLDATETVHLVIDMQNVFAERTEWHLPGMLDLVPSIVAVAGALPARTLFTRFVVPHRAEHAKGRWQHYYRRWHGFTGAVLDPNLVEIVDGLIGLATPEVCVDKPTYSVFEVAGFEERLAKLGANTLIFTGVETDVCVLASMMSAIDRGYRVVAAADAMSSSSRAGHEATLNHVLPRMPDQVEITDTDTVLAALRTQSAT